MQFLKTLFWVVLAIVAVIFAMNNWTSAKVMLWGGLILDIKLPVLVLGAFLIGFLPTFGWHRASRWRMQRRLESHERALADMRGIGQMTAPEATAPSVAAEEPSIIP
jgi:lipopolysaccharide assembly protein A